MLSHDDDCIIAQCTPQGKGALALLRISGKNARSVVDQCAHLSSKKSILSVTSHTVSHGWIIDASGQRIDEVMFIVMDGPRTFTGLDVIEITCHNNPFLIEKIIDRLIKQGARLAQEGEFTRRAFLSGKVDLIQAEAIHELIAANTQHALKKSLSQLGGSFSSWVSTLEVDLIRTLAWCEASFEFLDEEVSFKERIKRSLEEILLKIEDLKRTFDAQQQIRQGIKIALIGSVNAGKSSLFNALLQQPRAIVTPLAGTTRDAIEAGLTHKGNFWTLIDTAGLRTTHDIIEQQGIARSHEEAQKADIILLVFDSTRDHTDQERADYDEILKKYYAKCICVYNKSDLANKNSLAKNGIDVSSLTRTGFEILYTALENKIEHLFASMNSPFLINKRHHALLTNLEEKLKATLSLLTGIVAYEIVSYHLQDALTTLTELTGKSISEAGLDQVFKEFCVGK